ncbi:MAG: 50S ribosomal protein L29 [Planctomycetota bacterium]|jgi:large subunit ribosomal protein L29
MKIAEMRGKDSRELRLDMQGMRKELFELKFRGASEEISNSSRFRDLRRGIARINTILRERDMAAEGVEVDAAAAGSEKDGQK